MKLRLTLLLSAILCLGMFSCIKEELHITNDNEGLLITITAGATEYTEENETRTNISTGRGRWDIGVDEHIGLFMGTVKNCKLSGRTADEGLTVKFSGNLGATLANGPYTAYAYYPHGTIAQEATDPLYARVNLPAVQEPLLKSFDPKAHIMYANPFSVTIAGSAVVDNISANFNHAVAFIKVVFSNIGAATNGEPITKFTLTNGNSEQYLTGRKDMNLATGAFKDYEATGFQTPYVTAVYNEADNFALNGVNAIYLCVYPGTLTGGTQLRFEAETDSYKIKKEITLSSTEKVPLRPGHVTTMHISAPTITQHEPVLYRQGITRISADSLAFVLFAPGKTEVYLIGDFNDWTPSEAYKMKKTGDFFRLKIGNLEDSKEYICQYLIDNTIRIGDPYANKISDPYHDQYITAAIYPNMLTYPAGQSGIAMVVSTAIDNYNWQVPNFTPPAVHDLVIYEMLIRDFTDQSTIKAAKDKLPYLQSLGINAVKIMPFNEFDGNDSWGYNPTYYFATDKAYGTSRDYKEFIDACHQNGMAVIMDMVLNHSWGQSPLLQMYRRSDNPNDQGYWEPAANNPWYNYQAPHDWSWGADFNHESIHTQHFVDSVCAYWMKEYKIDGFRFDFTKGFTNKPGDGWYYDQSRVNILKRMADEIWKRKPNAFVVLEHLTDNWEEMELAKYGMLLWGNMNHSMNEATMGWTNGWNSDITWASHMERGWTSPNTPHLIAYMESHDEERIMYKNLTYGNSYGGHNVKDLTTALKRTAAAAVIYFTIPGPKMIWQFGELGYDITIDFNGRTGRKPTKWEYYNVPERKALHDVFATMASLKKAKSSLFNPPNYTYHTYDLRESVKYVSLFSSSDDLVAVANFDMVTQTKNVEFRKTGTWKCYFTNQTLNITSAWQNVTLPAGEYRLYFRQ